MRKLSQRQLRLVAVVVAGILLVAAWFLLRSPQDEAAQAEIETAVQQALNESRQQPPRAVSVYEVIAPSIVIVEARDGTGDADGSGLGTGVIVNADGSILTALHVVAGAQEIAVTYSDGTTTTASLVASVPGNDTATLAPLRGPDVLVPAVIGSPQQLDVGDDAYVVGHPLGFAGSLSAGVISGLERRISVSDDLELEGLIQFDAAVSPGNSGGPLLNRDGQVVGIVTALANSADAKGFVGIGLAVPINFALGGGGGGPGL